MSASGPGGPHGQTALGRHPPAQCMLGYTPLPSAGIHTFPMHSACWDTVNKQAVLAVLECILVPCGIGSGGGGGR